MRNAKYFIFVILFFFVIGFAAVSVSLSLVGNATVTTDIDDFKVYFSDVLVNDVQDLTLVKSETELVFDLVLDIPGETYKISYDVTNASKLFDASLAISCTQGDEYVSVVNSFDTSTNLVARSTRTGNLTIKKTKSNANEEGSLTNISCSIVATPISRDNESSGDVIGPLSPYEYAVGKEISIGEEKFNVISSTDTTVTMLAQYNIGEDYKQTTTSFLKTFSLNGGWEYTPGPKEIDVKTYSSNYSSYLNSYQDYLKSLIGDETLTTDLITLKQLGKLGCVISDDYTSVGSFSCINADYSSWIVNGQTWFTRSATPNDQYSVWYVGATGALYTMDCSVANSIRPIVTVSKEALSKNIIEFTIDGTTYRAYEGMNWVEWSSNFYFSGGTYYTDDYYVWGDLEVVADEDNNLVAPDDKIIANVKYVFVSP